MSPTQKKVLVVDDDQLLAKILSHSLSEKGFLVTTARNGQEALDKLGKGRFSYMVLDLIMPDKNGFDVLDEMRKKKDKTPVVILSNLSQQEDKGEVFALGAKGYFVKATTSADEVSRYICQQLDH